MRLSRANLQDISDGRLSWLATVRLWAINGMKRRSIKVLVTICVAMVTFVIFFLYLYASMYGWFHTRNPCMVATESQHRINAFMRRSIAKPNFKPTLPKIIHQQWKTDDIPEGLFKQVNQKFKELFPEPEYEHILWTDKTMRELIKTDYPFFLETYDGYPWGIQRADSSRYFIMHKFGGLYADLDYEPIENFWDYLATDRVSLIESPYTFSERVQNSLMASPAGDPFWEVAFMKLAEHKNEKILLSTGPKLLDSVLAASTEQFYILPCENFHRIPLGLSGLEDHSPFVSRLAREILARLVPSKYCGDFHDDKCQLGKHHNAVSYQKETGIMAVG